MIKNVSSLLRRDEKPALFTEVLDRRDNIQILADVIAVCREPTRITKLIRLANIQYHVCVEAVSLLVKAGFLKATPLKCTDRRKIEVFSATDLGIAWCDRVRSLYEALWEASSRGGADLATLTKAGT